MTDSKMIVITPLNFSLPVNVSQSQHKTKVEIVFRGTKFVEETRTVRRMMADWWPSSSALDKGMENEEKNKYLTTRENFISLAWGGNVDHMLCVQRRLLPSIFSGRLRHTISKRKWAIEHEFRIITTWPPFWMIAHGRVFYCHTLSVGSNESGQR